MSHSVRLHRRQPTSLLCPCDSPDKNTGVVYHFLLQCMHACQVASVMSDSLRPYGQQPTRLPRPWDSPGKNTGVGCHFLLQCMHACQVTSVVSDSVQPYGQRPTRLLCPWDSPGKNTGAGCHFLLPQTGLRLPQRESGGSARLCRGTPSCRGLLFLALSLCSCASSAGCARLAGP